MQLKPGQRLRSAVCDTEVVVIRAPADPVDLRCGGAPLIAHEEARPGDAEPDPAAAAGTQLGKRYADEDLGLEVLVTKSGRGSLGVGQELLGVKEAKPLPSSD